MSWKTKNKLLEDIASYFEVYVLKSTEIKMQKKNRNLRSKPVSEYRTAAGNKNNR